MRLVSLESPALNAIHAPVGAVPSGEVLGRGRNGFRVKTTAQAALAAAAAASSSRNNANSPQATP